MWSMIANFTRPLPAVSASLNAAATSAGPPASRDSGSCTSISPAPDLAAALAKVFFTCPPHVYCVRFGFFLYMRKASDCGTYLTSQLGSMLLLAMMPTRIRNALMHQT